MKKSILILLLLPIFTIAQKKITITFQYTQRYCGGAAPTSEILEALEKPQALENEILFICKKGQSKKRALKIKSNSLGQVQINLQPGEYNIYSPKKIKPFKIPEDNNICKYDLACLQQDYISPDYVLLVTKSTRKYTLSKYKACSWEKNCATDGVIPPP